MRRAINSVISVVYTSVRLAFIKLIHQGCLRYGMIERISPNVVLELEKKGKLIFGNKASIHTGCKLKVRKGGTLELGENVFLNYGCMLMCRDNIRIGEGCEFGPNVLVYDHDHDLSVEGGLKQGDYVSSPVVVGKNCWIGANTVILRGTNIGDNCVVGAGSILKGVYPANSKIIQKRVTTVLGVNGHENSNDN